MGRSWPWGRGCALVACLLALVSCGDLPDVARDPAPFLQTDEVRYDWTRHDFGYSTEIAYTYRNDTGVRVLLDACEGDVRPLLQVQRDGRWVDAWHPLMRNCPGEPLVIEPGDRWDGSVRVIGAPPASNVTPNFVFEDVEGVYRLYWFQARLEDSGPNGAPTRPDDLWRTSNPFVVAFP